MKLKFLIVFVVIVFILDYSNGCSISCSGSVVYSKCSIDSGQTKCRCDTQMVELFSVSTPVCESSERGGSCTSDVMGAMASSCSIKCDNKFPVCTTKLNHIPPKHYVQEALCYCKWMIRVEALKVVSKEKKKAALQKRLVIDIFFISVVFVLSIFLFFHIVNFTCNDIHEFNSFGCSLLFSDRDFEFSLLISTTFTSTPRTPQELYHDVFRTKMVT